MQAPNEQNSEGPQELVERQETVAGSNISDLATHNDRLGFKPYVESLAAFLTHKDTKPPITISIEGEWGSGKSSFMLLLRDAINEHTKQPASKPGTKREINRAPKPKIVSFNAWRLEKEEALWAGFALSVIRELAGDLGPVRRVAAYLKLQASRFDWKSGSLSLVRFIAILLLLIYVAAGLVRYISANPGSLNPFVSGEKDPETALLKLLLTGAGAAGYIFVAAMLARKAVDVVGNPFVADLRRFISNPQYEGRVSFIEQFHKDFDKIINAYAEGKTVFVFIDDLDRCELPKAAELMQGINLLISDTCKIIYILGLDREKVAAGLTAKFKEIIPYLHDETRDGSAHSNINFGYGYLEKFIQIPFQVPRPTGAGIQELLNSLNPASAPSMPPRVANVSPGILFETSVDSDLVRNIVTMVAPALNYNPRRVKQFINCFRVSAIITSQTGLFGAPRKGFSRFTPEQLGKLVAISLRWPLLIADASTNSKLLNGLQEVSLKRRTATTKLERYWSGNPHLLDLLTFGADESHPGGIDSRHSLSTVDFERYLQVSPRITAAGQPTPPQPPGRQFTKKAMHEGGAVAS